MPPSIFRNSSAFGASTVPWATMGLIDIFNGLFCVLLSNLFHQSFCLFILCTCALSFCQKKFVEFLNCPNLSKEMDPIPVEKIPKGFSWYRGLADGGLQQQRVLCGLKPAPTVDGCRRHRSNALRHYCWPILCRRQPAAHSDLTLRHSSYTEKLSL